MQTRTLWVAGLLALAPLLAQAEKEPTLELPASFGDFGDLALPSAAADDELLTPGKDSKKAKMEDKPAAQPSFDCEQAYSPINRLICSDVLLAELDRVQDERFAAAMDKTAADDRQTLLEDQRRWMRERYDQCHIPNYGRLKSKQELLMVACLRELYQGRLQLWQDQAAQPNLHASPLDRRVALVVANSSYPNINLHSATTNAAELARRLRTQGWSVNVVLDANYGQLRRAMGTFIGQQRVADQALFVYAGLLERKTGKDDQLLDNSPANILLRPLSKRRTRQGPVKGQLVPMTELNQHLQAPHDEPNFRATVVLDPMLADWAQIPVSAELETAAADARFAALAALPMPATPIVGVSNTDIWMLVGWQSNGEGSVGSVASNSSLVSQINQRLQTQPSWLTHLKKVDQNWLNSLQLPAEAIVVANQGVYSQAAQAQLQTAGWSATTSSLASVRYEQSALTLIGPDGLQTDVRLRYRNAQGQVLDGCTLQGSLNSQSHHQWFDPQGQLFYANVCRPNQQLRQALVGEGFTAILEGRVRYGDQQWWLQRELKLNFQQLEPIDLVVCPNGDIQVTDGLYPDPAQAYHCGPAEVASGQPF